MQTEHDQSKVHAFKYAEWNLNGGLIGYALSDVDGEHWRTLVRFATGTGEPTSKVLRLTLTPQRPGGVSGTVTVHYLLRDWNLADWSATAEIGDPVRTLWGTAGAKGLTDISNPVTSEEFSGEWNVPFTVDIDLSAYPLAVFSQFGLRLIGSTGVLTCSVSAKLILTWPEYTVAAASLALPNAGISAAAFYANWLGSGEIALPTPGLDGAGYYLPPGHELLGHRTLPEWFSGDIVVSQISAEQPLRFFLRAADNSAAIGKSPVVTIRKHGAPAWTTPLGTVSELGHGWYQVAYVAADQDVPGQLLLRATADGCQAAGACYIVGLEPVDANVVSIADGVKVNANLVAIDEDGDATDEAVKTLKQLYDGGVSRAAVSDYSPTTTSFLTTLPLEDPDHYADQAVVFTSGGLAGQTAHVDASETEGSLTRLTLAAALTAVPADGDGIVVIGRLA